MCKKVTFENRRCSLQDCFENGVSMISNYCVVHLVSVGIQELARIIHFLAEILFMAPW